MRQRTLMTKLTNQKGETDFENTLLGSIKTFSFIFNPYFSCCFSFACYFTFNHRPSVVKFYSIAWEMDVSLDCSNARFWLFKNVQLWIGWLDSQMHLAVAALSNSLKSSFFNSFLLVDGWLNNYLQRWILSQRKGKFFKK